MKNWLFTAGPTSIPERVQRAMAKPMLYHRSAEFSSLFKACQSSLCWLLETQKPPFLLASSGTGVMEAALVNFFSKGDTVLCVNAGKFGERWLKMAQAFGLNALPIEVVPGRAVQVEQVELLLKKHPQTKGVLCAGCETSTGVRHPFEALGSLLASKEDCLFLVDGISSVGVFEIVPEKHHIDVLVMSSQKGLMCPPGLGLLWASEKALKKQPSSNLPKYHFDLSLEQSCQTVGQTAFTPIISLIFGLKEALDMMQEEGKEKLFSRNQSLALATRSAIKALGLSLFAETPSEGVTSVLCPDFLSASDLCTDLWDRAKMRVSLGQRDISDRLFRIGHMGFVSPWDLYALFGALELSLLKLGYDRFQLGSSSAALTEIFRAR